MSLLYLVASGLLIGGIALAVWGALYYRRLVRRYADASARWVKGSATVLEARVLEREHTDSNDNSHTSYEPRLRYSYAVDGAAHEGQRVALCGVPDFGSQKRADEWLGRHSTGAVIDLWYDPTQPSDSATILDRPSLFRAILGVAAGLVLAGMGAMIFSAPL